MASTSERTPALPEDVIRVLIEVADRARVFSHAPYSRYRVGAALLAASGKVYSGVNVENASYGLAICSERTAYVKAVSEGERAFVAIAVVTDNGGAPCGACRQFMAEFGLDTWVIIADAAHRYEITTVGALLPEAFTPTQLKQARKRTTAARARRGE
ncbi:MAG: cytidine deaminase [Anaerolineae bacterium]|nr:cytidine deaminase [Thermoflexales bacterium]MCX7939669.1 cytidine deaminase [Thermoflexales bacterium]MDW8053311.1 cytidine deaminase [Anaerolineae bacterium]